MRAVGIKAVGATLGEGRLDLKELGRAWGRGGGGLLALGAPDEDALTLAWQAATTALHHAGAIEPEGLYWGTSTPPLAEGPSLATLEAALAMRPGSEALLAAGAPDAGLQALAAAWDAVAAGRLDVALAVASDAVVPGPGTTFEARTAAGAAAFVLAADGGPATLLERANASRAVADRVRPRAAAATRDVYDQRLVREQAYLPTVREAVERLAQRLSRQVGRWSVADPEGRLARSALPENARMAGTAHARLGDPGAAAAMLGALEALAAPEGEEVVGLVAYGGGRAVAMAIEVAAPVPGAELGVGHGRHMHYLEVLRARGALEAEVDPVPMALPPGSGGFLRASDEALRLQGARCRACGSVSVPPSAHPTCVRCGASDLELVRLARTGRVETFAINYTMPPPFEAPLPLVVVSLEDGASVMVQGLAHEADRLAVGERVELVLRRYALERGVPVYGYKAALADTRSAQGAEGNGAIGGHRRAQVSMEVGR
jgi:hydroxymethylglutaryl-CoA synthase